MAVAPDAYRLLVERLAEADRMAGREPVWALTSPLMKTTRPARRGGGVTHGVTLGGSSLLIAPARSGEARVIDALITIGVAAGSVLWTATRPTPEGEFGWGAFWTLLGGFMFLEGAPGSEIKAAGAGLSGANASYLSLRLFHPNLAS